MHGRSLRPPAASDETSADRERYVILARLVATFGMQEVLDNALTLTAVMALGALATLLGSPLVFAAVIGLIQASFRVTDQDPPQTRAILRALLNTSRPEQAPQPDGTAPGS